MKRIRIGNLLVGCVLGIPPAMFVAMCGGSGIFVLGAFVYILFCMEIAHALKRD